MNISCSLVGMIGRVYPKQGVGDIVKAGFQNVFLDMGIYCTEQELEECGKSHKRLDAWSGMVPEEPEKLEEALSNLLSLCQSNQLQVSLARAPYFLRNTKRNDLNQRIRELAVESIRNCGKIGCKQLIIRPLFAGVEPGQEWEVNREYYGFLADVAREQGVTILLENQCRSVNGHLVRGICSEASEAVEWIDRLNQEAREERFGFCLDVGVCNMCGQDMNEMVRTLGRHIKAVMIRDNDGHNESSMLPFTCAVHGQSQTDWLGLIRSLREIGYDGQLILDMKDTAAAFSPLLRPQLMSLAKSVAEYFEWQISLENMLRKYKTIVLFGAGNMCKNYMTAYGEKYPPLFTCDNNEKLWGSQVCGLEVKSPEVLKDLPEGSGIFICNIYYREIEQQLREMGIENIEFFNDEYMPSFYLDGWKGGMR